MFVQTQPGRCFLGRIPRGEDLLASINRFCQQQDIQLATVQMIGAVECACIGWYDPRIQAYTEPVLLEGGLEILSCHGTVSIMDNRPQAHLHLAVSGADCLVRGGHLHPGTLVYNVEFHLQEQWGATLVRGESATLRAPVWFPEPISA